jgi:hypothetical protein
MVHDHVTMIGPHIILVVLGLQNYYHDNLSFILIKITIKLID